MTHHFNDPAWSIIQSHESGQGGGGRFFLEGGSLETLENLPCPQLIVTLKAYLIRVDVDLVVIDFQIVKNLLKWLYFLGAQMQQKYYGSFN